MQQNRFVPWLVLALAACNGGGTGEDDPTGEMPAAGEGVVRCSYNYRQSNELMPGQSGQEPDFQFTERVLSVAPNEDASELLGQITFAVRYSADEFEGDSIQLSASAGDARVISILYQLGGALPRNEFVGGHGFTGLLYFTHPTAGGDYQAYCESVR